MGMVLADFMFSTKNKDETWTCNYVYHLSNDGTTDSDYYQDVKSFQYYNSTANPIIFHQMIILDTLTLQAISVT